MVGADPLPDCNGLRVLDTSKARVRDDPDLPIGQAAGEAPGDHRASSSTRSVPVGSLARQARAHWVASTRGPRPAVQVIGTGLRVAAQSSLPDLCYTQCCRTVRITWEGWSACCVSHSKSRGLRRASRADCRLRGDAFHRPHGRFLRDEDREGSGVLLLSARRARGEQSVRPTLAVGTAR